MSGAFKLEKGVLPLHVILLPLCVKPPKDAELQSDRALLRRVVPKGQTKPSKGSKGGLGTHAILREAIPGQAGHAARRQIRIIDGGLEPWCVTTHESTNPFSVGPRPIRGGTAGAC